MIDDAILFYWAPSQHLLIKMHGAVSGLFVPSEFIDRYSGRIIVWLSVCLSVLVKVLFYVLKVKDACKSSPSSSSSCVVPMLSKYKIILIFKSFNSDARK